MLILMLATAGFLHLEVAGLSYSQAEEFLKKSMPLRDKLDLSEDFISNNIRQALGTRDHMHWAKDIPDDAFLDYVLPYSR